MNTSKFIESKLGPPVMDTNQLVRVYTPFPMVIAWDTSIKIKSFFVNTLIKGVTEFALDEIKCTYGIKDIERLKINHFGGCHNYRKKRNGSTWSAHAWALAIDLHPAENKLTWGPDKAAFARPEYKPLLDIMDSYGFYNLGTKIGRDFMHFEFDLQRYYSYPL